MTLAQRVGQLAREQELTQRCAKFFDVARFVVLENDRIHDPAGQTATSKHIQQILKSVVAAGSTTGWGQSLAPYTQLVNAFLLSLRSASAFDAMLPWMKAVPLHQQIVVASGGATAGTVAEGTSKPIAELLFSVNQITENKTVCIVAVTNELLRNTTNQLFAQELTHAVASATDGAFINKITAGISPLSSNGGTSVAILQDLAALLAALSLDASSKVFLIVSSDITKRWAVSTTATGELAFP
jgi:HK97 family phage major capsid protein